jgi:uncharacterized cofD-like protein
VALARKPEAGMDRFSAHVPLRIVAIGGGTGLSTVLKGLKRYAATYQKESPLSPAVEITAVVTVTDDGGSSGRLRRDFDILPPGDIRNCMAALADDESLMTQLFQYRFDSGRGLKGHSFGNLFLTALTHMTGDFATAVRLSSEVLAINGRIFPSTAENVTLRARLESGRVVDGETRISRSDSPIRELELRPATAKPLTETIKAIREADLITMGPGSLFTSLIPNLLVKGIPAAIQRSPAIKACFVNLMWQPGETTGMSASDHIAAIQRHAGRRLIDYAIVNTDPIEDNLLVRYARERAMQVTNDIAQLKQLGVQPVGMKLLAKGEKVRHDSDMVAMAAVELAKKARRRIVQRREKLYNR